MKHLTIAIIGQGSALPPLAEKAAQYLAQGLASFRGVLHTGACGGVTGIAVAELRQMKSKARIVGFSPAVSLEEHLQHYRYPSFGYDEIHFCGRGNQARSLDLLYEADAALMIAGQMGTLLEFVLAYRSGKVVGVVPIPHSASDRTLLDLIVRNCSEPHCGRILFDGRPKRLVARVLAALSDIPRADANNVGTGNSP